MTLAGPRKLPVTLVFGGIDGAGTHLALELAQRSGPAPVLLHPGELEGPPPPGVEVVRISEEVAHRAAGCPCCSVRLDLIDALSRLSRRRHRPSWVTVANLPGADPATPVVTMLDDPELRSSCVIDGIVVAGGRSTLPPTTSGDDTILLADRIWPGGDPTETKLLGLRAWSLGRTDERLADLRSGRTADRPSTWMEVTGLLDPDLFEVWLQEVHATVGAGLLRLDAVLALAGEERRHLVVGCRTTTLARRGRRWGPAEDRASRIRLVGRRIQEQDLFESLLACTI